MTRIEWTEQDPAQPPSTFPSELADFIEESRLNKKGKTKSNGVDLAELGSREEILEWLGHLARVGLSKEEYFATLQTAKDTGRIIDLDPVRPWTDKDLRTLADEAADWDQAEDMVKVPEINFVKKKHEVRDLSGNRRINAAELLEQDIDPLEYVIDEIMPTGLGLVSGAPKIGKSWLVLQSAIEIATGGALLGRQTHKQRPVLYYALEDGSRRLQSRIRQLVGNDSRALGLLEFRLEGPGIGSGLEEEIALWLDDNDEDGVVFIDVLAMIRPRARGRGSAYDEDYAVMRPLREILSPRPGATIVPVTHDRKAGSDDFLTTVTGTRGVTGAVDWAWVLKRPRLVPKGVINVIGRDLEEQAIDALFRGEWVADAPNLGGASTAQDEILDALITEGDLTSKELIHYLYPETISDLHEYKNKQSATSEKLRKLLGRGVVEKTSVPVPGKTGAQAKWHILTEDEIKKKYLAVRQASEVGMKSSVTVRKVSKDAT